MRCSLSVVAGAAASFAMVSFALAGTGAQDPPLPILGRTVALVITPSTMQAVPGQSVQFYISAIDTMGGSYIANAQFSLGQTNLVVSGATFAETAQMYKHSSTTRAVVNPLANRNNTGGIDSRDVLLYTNAYSTQFISADLDGSNTVTNADLAIFRTAYDANPPVSGASPLPFAGMYDALQTILWGDTALVSGTMMLGVVTVQIDPNAPVGSTARLDGTMHTAAVYDNSEGLFARAASVQNGFGAIQVVPAPSAAGILGIAALAAFRRRRA